MAYLRSNLDKVNLGWFEKDKSKSSLIRLEIRKGGLRGLQEIKVHFKYPITVISGRNGTGKSTLLGCAACAFKTLSFTRRPVSLKPYDYKFSDFFVQSPEESTDGGIQVAYQTLDADWQSPDSLGWHYCFKRPSPGGSDDPFGILAMVFGGPMKRRWSRHRYTPRRDVVYLGVERVVPHAEKSVSKTYSREFKKMDAGGYEDTARELVSRVLGRPYEEFYFKTHKKYRLPLVKSHGRTYSGLNMGAGENTLFEIFSTILATKQSLLLVIDEIELGLHEEAQIKLIEELKEICSKRHIQIICTTHSPRVINSLPPEARIHLEKELDSIRVIPEISAEYAAGLMSGVKQAELDIVCEDSRAQSILSLSLPNEVRQRVEIIPIGSAAAVVRYMAFRSKDHSPRKVCCFLDGDKAGIKQTHLALFVDALEQVKDKEQARQWIEDRLAFLPGATSPEKWVISKHDQGAFKRLTKEFGLSASTLDEYVEAAKLVDGHDVFYELSKRLNQPVETIESRFIQCALEKSKPEVLKIIKHVKQFLS